MFAPLDFSISSPTPITPQDTPPAPAVPAETYPTAEVVPPAPVRTSPLLDETRVRPVLNEDYEDFSGNGKSNGKHSSRSVFDEDIDFSKKQRQAAQAEKATPVVDLQATAPMPAPYFDEPPVSKPPASTWPTTISWESEKPASPPESLFRPASTRGSLLPSNVVRDEEFSLREPLPTRFNGGSPMDDLRIDADEIPSYQRASLDEPLLGTTGASRSVPGVHQRAQEAVWEPSPSREDSLRHSQEDSFTRTREDSFTRSREDSFTRPREDRPRGGANPSGVIDKDHPTRDHDSDTTSRDQSSLMFVLIILIVMVVIAGLSAFFLLYT
ncbi:MAG: hypothetical protein FWD55_05310 [Propionibacteriaceae bacterium]|nr:hypothetical protein [Propionibacteriaceae bacterium]